MIKVYARNVIVRIFAIRKFNNFGKEQKKFHSENSSSSIRHNLGPPAPLISLSYVIWCVFKDNF